MENVNRLLPPDWNETDWLTCLWCWPAPSVNVNGKTVALAKLTSPVGLEWTRKGEVFGVSGGPVRRYDEIHYGYYTWEDLKPFTDTP